LAGDVDAKQKTEGKKKPISFDSINVIRQWQTFILALIIIVAYIVFFGWMISISSSSNTTVISKTSNETNTSNTPAQSNKLPDYSGMTTLTGTFGIIAAAVVGYYFGTRNLKQAADLLSQHATQVTKDAKHDAEKKDSQLKREKKERVLSLNAAIPIYARAKKLVDDTNQKQPNQDLTELSGDLQKRIDQVNHDLNTKNKEIEHMEYSKDEE
jgi:lipopolysaccharide export LptBFGC system permease protein LptF